jgi:hypothetical protein
MRVGISDNDKQTTTKTLTTYPGFTIIYVDRDAKGA